VVSRKQLWSAAERGILPWRSFVQQVWTGEVQAAAGSAAVGDAFWRAALSRGFVDVPHRLMPANRKFTAIPAPTAAATPVDADDPIAALLNA
jgi:hypothetical protein